MQASEDEDAAKSMGDGSESEAQLGLGGISAGVGRRTGLRRGMDTIGS